MSSLYLDIPTVIASVTAAIYWYKSSQIKLTPIKDSMIAGMDAKSPAPGTIGIEEDLHNQSNLNSRAAIAAAFAAIFQALKIINKLLYPLSGS
jgi:hypothetical protein